MSGGPYGSETFSSIEWRACGRNKATVTNASRFTKNSRDFSLSAKTSSTCGSSCPGANSVSWRSAGAFSSHLLERRKAPTLVPGEAQSVSAPFSLKAAKGPGVR